MAADSVLSADVKVGDPIRFGDRPRDRAKRSGVRNALVRTMPIIELLELA
jgi:hypothetical protein